MEARLADRAMTTRAVMATDSPMVVAMDHSHRKAMGMVVPGYLLCRDGAHRGLV